MRVIHPYLRCHMWPHLVEVLADSLWAMCLIWCLSIGKSLMIETEDWPNGGKGGENKRITPDFPVWSDTPAHFWDMSEWRRKSFIPQTCPENTHILKGVTFDNGVLRKMGWESLPCQGFMITKDCICFGLKAQQFSGLCPPKRYLNEETSGKISS